MLPSSNQSTMSNFPSSSPSINLGLPSQNLSALTTPDKPKYFNSHSGISPSPAQSDPYANPSSVKKAAQV